MGLAHFDFAEFSDALYANTGILLMLSIGLAVVLSANLLMRVKS